MDKNYREKYGELLNGGGIVYGRDLLATLLSNAFGGKDMYALADELLTIFPSVKAVLTAPLSELSKIEGVSFREAQYLVAAGAALRFRCPALSNIEGIDDFISRICGEFTGCDSEHACFYLINNQGKVLASRRFTSNRTDSVSVPTDQLMRFLSGSEAHGLYCAHNHVSTDCTPSRADNTLTCRISRLCKLNSVIFYDHAITDTSGNVFSYALSGRLDKLKG